MIGKRTADVRINIQQDLRSITDRQEYKLSLQRPKLNPALSAICEGV